MTMQSVEHIPGLELRAQFRRAARTLQGLGEDLVDTTATTGESWSDFLQSLPAVLRDVYLSYNQAEAQQKLMDINFQRALRGEPPLNIDLSTFRPGVQVGVSSDLKSMMWVLGLGALGVGAYALTRKR